MSRGESSLLSDPVRSSSKPGTPDLVSAVVCCAPCTGIAAGKKVFLTLAWCASQEWVAAHVASSSGAPKKLGPGPVLPPIGSSVGVDDLHDEDGRHAVEALLAKKRPTSANKKFLAKYGLTGWSDGHVRMAV